MPYKSRKLVNPKELRFTRLFRFSPERLDTRAGRKLYAYLHVGHGAWNYFGGEIRESERTDCDYVIKRPISPRVIPLTHGTFVYEVRENLRGKRGANRLRYGVIVDESD